MFPNFWHDNKNWFKQISLHNLSEEIFPLRIVFGFKWTVNARVVLYVCVRVGVSKI